MSGRAGPGTGTRHSAGREPEKDLAFVTHIAAEEGGPGGLTPPPLKRVPREGHRREPGPSPGHAGAVSYGAEGG